MNEKKIAIYSRKSKYTGTGESIENQIEMCKNHLILKYGKDILKKVIIYEDEGFSGANINRPNFQKMLTDFKDGSFEKLVVYRLDRVSRNVLDFCTLKEILSNLKVDFISITENFDTSSPMGEAMLMISSVFAQLERDTIAQRIKDNMTQLAKCGFWLGGTTPFGYESIEIKKKDKDGKIKKSYQLKIIKKEEEIIKIIFNKYLEFKSLVQVENYLRQEGIKTRKKNNFTRYSIKEILINPVYCKADEKVFNYLKKKNITLYKNNLPLNETYGLISFNKRKETKTPKGKVRKNKIKPIHEWIIAIGKHKGIISSKVWIKTQITLQRKRNFKRGEQK